MIQTSVFYPAALAMVLTCCSDPTERNIIKGRSPFMHVVFNCTPERRERIVSSARSFAEMSQMTFTYSWDEPRLGDLNTWVSTPEINLIAAHLGGLDSQRFHVIAVARHNPTSRDRTTAQSFLRTISFECRPR